MSVSIRTIPGNLASIRTVDTNVGTTVQDAASVSSKIHGVWVDNTANSGGVYVKMFNVASGSVTLGTTAPDNIFYVPGSTAMQFSFAVGSVFGTALSYACVTTGGTGGTTAPSSAVKVDLLLG